MLYIFGITARTSKELEQIIIAEYLEGNSSQVISSTLGRKYPDTQALRGLPNPRSQRGFGNPLRAYRYFRPSVLVD
jgi:hypothetical protein